MTSKQTAQIHVSKFSQFLFSRNQHGREKRENLHRAKISRYTVTAADMQNEDHGLPDPPKDSGISSYDTILYCHGR